jgi:hypothetical protein
VEGSQAGGLYLTLHISGAFQHLLWLRPGPFAELQHLQEASAFAIAYGSADAAMREAPGRAASPLAATAPPVVDPRTGRAPQSRAVAVCVMTAMIPFRPSNHRRSRLSQLPLEREFRSICCAVVWPGTTPCGLRWSWTTEKSSTAAPGACTFRVYMLCAISFAYGLCIDVVSIAIVR